MIQESTILDFNIKTGYDIVPFLINTSDFFQSDYLVFISYYQGSGQQLNDGNIKNYHNLVSQVNIVFDKIHQHSNSMASLEYIELIELVEEIDSRLKTVRNLHKWSRSYIQKFGLPSTQLIDYTLQPNQTLEFIASKLDENNNEKWLEIALDNNLDEEDYTSEGNKHLLLRNIQDSRTANFSSIVDYIDGKTIYGKDVKRKLQFDDDDILTLGYDDTLQQSVEVLAGIRKNSHPGYRKIGIQSDVVAGSNKATVSIPIITRQLQEIFSTDDSLKRLRIKNFAIEQDNLFLDFDIETRLDEIIEKSTVL